jgi:hypothetical protein
MSDKIKFLLNGCDICFVAEAPKNITLEQLLKQCDKIKPYYCACGICSIPENDFLENEPVDLIIDYESIRKTNEDVNCEIKE